MGAGAQEPNAHKDAATAELTIRQGADGSFSLWSPRFGEGFHSRRGALREARETFLAPSQLERFSPGQRLTVVEVCAGTGTNLAALIEACTAAELELEWWGLELDPAPLQLALAEPAFRSQWHPQTLKTLETLSERGCWQQGCWQQGCWQQGAGSGRMLWGDARQTLPQLLEQRRGQVDLIWHDAFSPQHCPQLWTVEFLGSLAELLADGGRWISFCSAAAVREGLRLANLNLAALATPNSGPSSGQQQPSWSGGTVASHQHLEPSVLWRPLSSMELEHMSCSAGEPYRDPTATANAADILHQRHIDQAKALALGERSTSSAWRKHWGL
ncbi:MAG: MnmC family methyltransferase [Cyanobacteria bacterium]|nr:MnmC family methyltransferase [Cyanobacteriota bacterium]